MFQNSCCTAHGAAVFQMSFDAALKTGVFGEFRYGGTGRDFVNPFVIR